MTPLVPGVLVAAMLVTQIDEADGTRQASVQYFREQAQRQAIVPADGLGPPLTLVAEPVLRYSSPTGPTSDAAIFVWLAGGRPDVVASFSLRRPAGDTVRECASFSGRPLECRVEDRAVWSPQGGSFSPRELPDAPPPAESKVQRLVQMRNLARRFSGRRYNWRETDVLELRLLTTPLYRFEDPEQGILDGAIFSFVKGTDPEVLLLLEAKGSDRKTAWHYSLARMSSQKQVMRLDDQEIWTVPLYSRGVSAEEKRTGHYQEAVVGR